MLHAARLSTDDGWSLNFHSSKKIYVVYFVEARAVCGKQIATTIAKIVYVHARVRYIYTDLNFRPGLITEIGCM